MGGGRRGQSLLLKKRDPQLYANLEQSVQYITKLYNSSSTSWPARDIKGFDDLRGKKVSFNLKDSQTEVSRPRSSSDMLELDVQRLNYDNDEALKKLRAANLRDDHPLGRPAGGGGRR